MSNEGSEEHYKLGMVLEGQRQIEAATAEFREAIRLNSNNLDARLRLGLNLKGRGQVEEAIAEFAEVLRISPNNPEARLYWGLILEEQGKLEEAMTKYREICRLNPGDKTLDSYIIIAHLQIGNALYEQGKLEEAIVEYQEAIRIKPTDPAAYACLGNVRLDQKELKKAELAFEKAKELYRARGDSKSADDLDLLLEYHYT